MVDITYKIWFEIPSFATAVMLFMVDQETSVTNSNLTNACSVEDKNALQ